VLEAVFCLLFVFSCLFFPNIVLIFNFSSSKCLQNVYKMFTQVRGYFPKSNIQVLGNAAIGHQNWDTISDFRVYSHMLPADATSWPHDLAIMPPINAIATRKWQDVVRSKTSNPSFVRSQIVKAGSLACLNLVIRIADFVSIRRAAMRAVANIACQPSLRVKIVQIDGFIDVILTTCSNLSTTDLEDWEIKEQQELVKCSKIAAMALR